MIGRPRIASDEEILAAIAVFWTVEGYAPAVRDIAEIVGYHTSSTVHSRLRELVDRGDIAMEPGITRSVRLTAQGRARLRLPDREERPA